MKKIVSISVLLFVLLSCFASGGSEKKVEETVEINVFAAQSLKASVSEVGDKFMAENPQVKVIFTFDSSGNLLKMLSAGADCDVFISADIATMDKIDPSELTTRVNLLQNKLVLAVAEGNPGKIESFDDLIAALKAGRILFAMGDSSVPAGNYTRKVFAYYGLDENQVSSSITYATNVAAVARQVKESAADCATIYSTDAFSNALVVVDSATDLMTGGPVIYPAAVLKQTKNTAAAEDFLKYMQTSPAARESFEHVGFTVL